MSNRLNLQKRKLGSAVEVTWNDAINQTQGFENASSIGTAVLTVVALATLFIMDEWVIGFIFFFGIVFVGIPIVIMVLGGAKMVKRFRYVPKSITISPTTFQTSSSTVPLADVTRIEYGNKGQWDGTNTLQNHRTQIRVWVNDRYSLLISENDWTGATNHQLRSEIDSVLTAMKKRAKSIEMRSEGAQTKPEHKTPKTGDYDIPDY